MSELSDLVLPLSYSVKDAMTGVEVSESILDSEGWISASDNSNNTVVIQIKLSELRTFNRLMFELLDVPSKFAIYFKDHNRNKFIKIKDFDGYVEGNLPGTVEAIKNRSLWQSFKFAFPFIETDTLEIRITRTIDSLASLNLPKTTSYSVGIRSAHIRFHRVGSELSTINEDSEYQVKFYAPSSVLSDSSAFWKSPPLGPNSLYPFYVDLRKENGKAQVVEFMKLIPLYGNSHVNIYMSNDESFGTFSLSNNKKSFALMQQESANSASTELTDNWLEDKGILLQSLNYWRVPNKDIKLSLYNSFTIGFTYEAKDFVNDVDHCFWSFTSDDDTLICRFSPEAGNSTQTTYDITSTTSADYKATLVIGSHPFNINDYVVIINNEEGRYNGTWKVYDTDSTSITIEIDDLALPSIASGSVRAADVVLGDLSTELNGNTIVSISDVTLVEGVEYGIILGYNNANLEWNFAICEMSTQDVNRVSTISQFAGFYSENFNFGFEPNLGVDTTDGSGYAKNIWLRQDSYQPAYVNAFLRNTSTFIKGLGNLSQRTNGFFNGLLVAELTDNLEARVGPNSNYYANKTWTPANRNFVLNSSIYNLGRTSAKFLKLEFAKPTVQYYNPATSEQVLLPIFDFPDWVKEWYVAHRFDPTVRASNLTNYIFEGSRAIRNTSSNFGVNSLKSAIESANNNLIYNQDQIGLDYLMSPANDEEALRNQIAKNAMTLQFPTTSRHNYKIFDYAMNSKRAFFYGILELSFFTLDQTVEQDNKVYYGDFLDGDIADVDWINVSTGFFVTEDNLAMAETEGDVIISEPFVSFSEFSAVQIGYLESPYVDLLSSSKINLADTSHLSVTENGSFRVVNNLSQSTDGQTVLLERVQDGQYILRTGAISAQTSTAGVKVVVGCRLRSGVKNPSANYELRLIDGDNNIVARKLLDLPFNYGWTEVDLIHRVNDGETEYTVEIAQLDSFSDETLYIDMLGLWRESNVWELSNDNGATWIPVTFNVNNALGIVSFESPGRELKIRITAVPALNKDSWVSEWIIVPVYDLAPVGMTSTRIFDVNDSDNPEYRKIIDQKFFLPYSTYIPINYSIISQPITREI